MIDRQGNTRHLTSRDFTMTPGRTWKSPKSGGVYPLEWTINVLGQNMTIKALLDKQERMLDRVRRSQQPSSSKSQHRNVLIAVKRRLWPGL